jgi:hypothetical protein
MRPHLHKKALARFAVGVSAAALMPASLVAVGGMSVAPVALAAFGVCALLGMSALRGSRARVTRARG